MDFVQVMRNLHAVWSHIRLHSLQIQKRSKHKKIYGLYVAKC